MLFCLLELEDEAAIPEERRLRMSGPDVDYCIYMLEKYGEDYEVRYFYTILYCYVVINMTNDIYISSILVESVFRS